MLAATSAISNQEVSVKAILQLGLLFTILNASSAFAEPDVERVFRGSYKGRECVAEVRYEKTSEGTTRVRAKIHGLISERSSGDWYWKSTYIQDDFKRNEYINGFPLGFLSGGGAEFKPGQTESDSDWFQVTYSEVRDIAKFTPSIEAPTSMQIYTGERIMYVLGSGKWFVCNNLVQLTGDEAKAATKLHGDGI